MRSMYPELNAFVREIAGDLRFGMRPATMIASAIAGAEAIAGDETECVRQRDAWSAILNLQRRIALAPAPLARRVDAWCNMVDRYMPERDN